MWSLWLRCLVSIMTIVVGTIIVVVIGATTAIAKSLLFGYQCQQVLGRMRGIFYPSLLSFIGNMTVATPRE
jgi:hypothetical protein